MAVPFNNRKSITRRRKTALYNLERNIEHYSKTDMAGKLERARECAVNLYRKLNMVPINKK